MKKVLVINGPNLNLIGFRELDVYGKNTYLDLEKMLKSHAKDLQIKLSIKQTNHEGSIIDYLHDALYKKYDGIIINPGAYTHYSYAIYDAIKAIKIPTVEVHLSNIQEREEFRKKSVIKEACVKSIMGKHFEGYIEAIEFLNKLTN